MFDLLRASRRTRALAALFGCWACMSERVDAPSSGPVSSRVTGAPQRADGTLIAAWNALAYEIAFAEDEFRTFKGHRACTMMHLAMHDAVNTVTPRARRYAYTGKAGSGADATVAAAQAAHEVLRTQYPGARARLDSALAATLGTTPNDDRRRHGVALGLATARAILERRAGDRWDFPGTYAFRSGPGQYHTTPPWHGFVAQPGFATANPFVIGSPRRFRPPPPPALTSARYAKAFDEVKAAGDSNSTVRTTDQTGYAIWWMEFPEGSVNRLARTLVAERHTDLWTAARLFALINASLYDGYIAVWDAKYTNNHWRPYTAIREAAADGNTATSAEPAWVSLRPPPPTPDYLSAHAAGCAASLGVLASTFGDSTPFSMRTNTAPPGMPTRSFTSFSSAAAECADSRVRIGFHFRYSTDAGLVLGRRVAESVMSEALRPRR